MELVITLRKQVNDQDEADLLFENVKQRLEDRPDITVRGHTTKSFIVEDKAQ